MTFLESLDFDLEFDCLLYDDQQTSELRDPQAQAEEDAADLALAFDIDRNLAKLEASKNLLIHNQGESNICYAQTLNRAIERLIIY